MKLNTRQVTKHDKLLQRKFNDAKKFSAKKIKLVTFENVAISFLFHCFPDG